MFSIPAVLDDFGSMGGVGYTKGCRGAAIFLLIFLRGFVVTSSLLSTIWSEV